MGSPLVGQTPASAEAEALFGEWKEALHTAVPSGSLMASVDALAAGA